VAVVGLRAAAPRRGVALPAAVVGRRPVLAARERTADPGDSRPAGPRSLHLHRDPPRGPRRVAVRGAARRCRALARPRRAAPAVLWALRGGVGAAVAPGSRAVSRAVSRACRAGAIRSRGRGLAGGAAQRQPAPACRGLAAGGGGARRGPAARGRGVGPRPELACAPALAGRALAWNRRLGPPAFERADRPRPSPRLG